MERKKRKIIRLNSKGLSLERRAYEALKKSKFNEDEWNLQGRHYNIKQLYNLSRTLELELSFGEEIGDDLETYKCKLKKNQSPIGEKRIKQN